MKLFEILFEENSIVKKLHGSNFLYRLKEYEKLNDDGLPQYAVNYSEFNKWGVNPSAGYFPKGIYFYYLHPKCRERAGTGTGFATNRTWVNIAKLNLDRFIVLDPGKPKNFGKESLDAAISKLKSKYKDLVGTGDRARKSYRFEDHYNDIPEFITLARILSQMQDDGAGSFNKLLHDAGYDGILDMAGVFLPIESCQGVQTWPGAADYIESINTPSSIRRSTPTEDQRRKNIYKQLQHQKNGELDLTEDEFRDIIDSFKSGFYSGDTDNKYYLMDLLGDLFAKINFNRFDLDNPANRVAQYVEKYGSQLWDAFERNPTTPKNFWQQRINSSFEDVRLAAKDNLR